jgi:hypothetical protein
MAADIKVDSQTEETPNTSVVTEGEQEVTQAQSNPHVEKATALGWMPKEDWVAAGHDEDDWKPAKTFLEVGELIGKVRVSQRELAETKTALSFVNSKNKEIYEKGYKAAITELRAQKRAALAEGDLVKADELDEKIDATRDELDNLNRQAQAPQQRQAPDPEHMEWVQRNPWYEQDGKLQRYADAAAIEYINVNRGTVTPAQVRDYVEKEVRKEFAHRFQPKTKGAPNPDGEGRSAGRQSGSNLDSKLAQAKANMSDQDRAIMKTMMRSAGLTEAAYLKLYAQG